MIRKTHNCLTIVCAALLITGCLPTSNDDLGSICKDSPELCTDIHQIGDCRYQRTSLIRARHYDKIEPNEKNTRLLLTELDQYESCLELTLFMQFTRNKQRKAHRLENYLKAQELMRDKLNTIHNTQDPHLAFYLWTRHQDLAAKEVFLAAATKNELQDTMLLFKLAAVYTKEDPQYSLTLFYRALQQSQSLDEIPKAVFMIIMSIYFQDGNYQHAYVWALIAQEEDENEEFPINLELILKKGLGSGPIAINNTSQLEALAKIYYTQLEDGVFNSNPPKLLKKIK